MNEVLGEVRAPLGTVLMVDAGLLNLWCHDRPPVMPDGILSTPEATASANASEDFAIEGRDAEAAGRAFDRQAHPLFLYDIPGHGAAAFRAQFEAFVKQKGFDARLVSLRPRVTHRARVDQSLAFGKGAGPVQFHGLPAIAVNGMPGDAMQVVGERVDDRWKHVCLEVRPRETVVRTRAAGSVAVDWARLLLIDADAIGRWQHDAPIDGKADFLFWGRDAEALAAKTNASRLDDGQFGWVDLDVHEVADRGIEVERIRDEKGWKAATDFRPHSDHYRLMAQVRASPTESGTIDVGGALCCGFMTTWGDGFFPVEVDLSASGAVVRVRVALAPVAR